MKFSFLLLSLLAALACEAGKSSVTAPTGPQQEPASSPTEAPPALELDNRIRCMLQGQDSAYWFGSDGQGVYRWRGEGATLERFTKEEGLPSDHIRGIQEDRSGNIFVCTEPGGVARFNGQGFTPLTAREPSESVWALQPDDLWFPAGQDTGAVFRWDGTALHRLAFPATPAGDAHYAELPRSLFPNAKYSPYDVFTIAKDGAGRVWFGTALLGACCFDGTHFTWVGHGENGSFGVRSIFEERQGVFWLSNNMNRYVEEASAPEAPGTAAPRFRKEPGIATSDDPHSVFMSSIRDQEGNPWLATLGLGVFQHHGTSWSHFPVLDKKEPVWIQQIYLDLGGRLWLATNEHGVFRQDDKNGPFKRVQW